MFEVTIGGIPLVFTTHPSLFSPEGLDHGTAAMLATVTFTPEDKILDLGCGYGPVGIYAARVVGEQRVTMTDIDPLAVALAKQNALQNGVKNLAVVQGDGLSAVADSGYTYILSNPPYHADFGVPKQFIEKGFNRLALGGKLVLVTKRLDWYKNKLTAIFGGVLVQEADGYYVFTAEKRGTRYANKK